LRIRITTYWNKKAVTSKIRGLIHWAWSLIQQSTIVDNDRWKKKEEQ
jgi:hypothetical protein